MQQTLPMSTTPHVIPQSTTSLATVKGRTINPMQYQQCRTLDNIHEYPIALHTQSFVCFLIADKLKPYGTEMSNEAFDSQRLSHYFTLTCL